MASSYKKVPSDRTSQLGIYATVSFALTLTDTTYLYPTVDMGDTGASWSVGWIVNNPGATQIKWTPQISMDGTTWKDVKWKDPDASETVAGEVTLAATTNVAGCIHFTAYPEYMTHRFFRIKIKSNTTPASTDVGHAIFITMK